MKYLLKHATLLVALFSIIGLFLHFYNLNWGAPYYFHPDERNIASSVSQLSFPDHMNPSFFAYGSLPIYTVYFTGFIIKPFLSSQFFAHSTLRAGTTLTSQVPFDQAILISRAYSALFATMLIPLLYTIGRRLHSQESGLLASFFATTSVGLMQFSHFGTFELWLTFFSTILFLICIDIIKKPVVWRLVLTGFVLGILISVKVTSLALAPLPLIAIFFHLPFRQFTKNKLAAIRTLGKLLVQVLFFCCLAALVYITTNPYAVTDHEAFKNSMNYESKVALGTLPVFYTQEFYKAPPVVFQLVYVYPFLLNPLLTLLLVPAIVFIIIETVRNKNKTNLLLLAFSAALFLSQALLFVKWTRYLVPTIPFFLLIIAITLVSLGKTMRKNYGAYIFSFLTLIGLCCLYITAYILVVLTAPDSRIAAANWTKLHIPTNSPTMSELYDLGILPFNSIINHITLCNTYDLETNTYPCDGQPVNTVLASSKIIILPSQRIYKTRFTNSQRYPAGAAFYQSLFSGRVGYHKVYETPCNLLCRILYLGNPVYSFEQTTTVFDRPTITIFEKK
jgi:hypothetical protein